MVKAMALVVAVMGAGVVVGAPDNDIYILGRGDANNDHKVNVTDVVFLNNFLYSGGPAPPCMNNADANGDGLVNNSDPVFLLNYLYNGGSAPPFPGPGNQSCVVNPTPSLHSCQNGC